MRRIHLTKTKPRGTVSGLIYYQQQSRDRARKALIAALDEMLVTSEANAITDISLCRRAGLASSAALKKDWNQDIVKRIKIHNSQVQEKNNTQIKPPILVTEGTNKRSELLIKKLRIELSIRDAEIFELESANTLLKSKIKRLQGN